MQIEVSTTQDKNQTHILTLSNGTQTIAKFQIPGATTILDANGTIRTTSQDGNITVVANPDGTAIHKVKFSNIDEDDYSPYGVSSHTTLAESKVMGAITTVSKDENNETQVKTVARMDLCDGTGYVEAIIITYETGESITRFYRYDTNDYLIASYETVLNGIFEPGNIDKIYEDSDDTCLKKINVRTKVRQTIGF